MFFEKDQPVACFAVETFFEKNQPVACFAVEIFFEKIIVFDLVFDLGFDLGFEGGGRATRKLAVRIPTGAKN